MLLIYVDDLVPPAVRVRLAELVQHRQERPRNLARLPGQAVRIVLAEPRGFWGAEAQELEPSAGWRA